MSRSKNYKIPGIRKQQQALPAPKAVDLAAVAGAVEGACIDMVALLGSDARFTRGERKLDHSAWLSRGIDSWVMATMVSLKAVLLSGTRETASVIMYFKSIVRFFEFLVDESNGREVPRVASPAGLTPLHVQAFIGWLMAHREGFGWTSATARHTYNGCKAVLTEMFAQGFIQGEPSRFFPRAAIREGNDVSRQTSLSDGEQERLANAIKSDLTALHHGRLTLKNVEVQALRFLLVAHRQGANLTPLLELHRDAMKPGLLPGTVSIRTAKYRNRKLRSGMGRSGDVLAPQDTQSEETSVLPMAEGAILQQAIAATRDLVDDAVPALKNRVWLYRSQATWLGSRVSVTCLNTTTLHQSIQLLVKRHQLLGDDSLPLKVNLSRLRKSFFDRALRASDGDLVVTANLMGNSPSVASLNYPSMNAARQADAAGFMNEEYVGLMRTDQTVSSSDAESHRLIPVQPFKAPADAFPTDTPVSGCTDTLNGEHAPRNGQSHCTRFVMCLFCSSFAIVGTVQELWRLFSFQAYARAELDYFDRALGPQRTRGEVLEDLRDRYRLAIPYIDEFTARQFAASKVARARAQTARGLHPFWEHQMSVSRRARVSAVEESEYEEPKMNGEPGERVGT